MSKPFLSIEFDTKSVDRVAVQIEEYANLVEWRMYRAITRLLEIGVYVAIVTANSNDTHHFAGLCDFTYAVRETDKGVEGRLIGMQTPVVHHWVDGDGKSHDSTVFPLLMLEFGSAGKALTSIDIGKTFGADRRLIGKGSMAIRGNEDKLQWYFVEYEGEAPKIGTAVAPSQPMWYAGLELYEKAITIIKEEFKE